MRRKLLSIFSVAFISTASFAQCGDLFISEYVEGSGNNKALELYNPTSSPINLNNEYRIVRWSNGDATADQNPALWINLGVNTVPANGTFVIVIDKRDPAGTGQEVQADPALQAVADTFLSPVYATNNTMYFNGDDAVSLQKYVGTTWVNLDIFGKIGEDPGTAWTDVFPYTGTGTWITANHTMVRKSTVQTGVTTNPTAFNPMAEWDTLQINTFTSLGAHTSDCAAVSVSENSFNSELKIFPNPSVSSLNVTSSEEFVSLSISDVTGKIVYSENLKSKNANINVNNIEKGIYFITLKNAEGLTATARFIKQ